MDDLLFADIGRRANQPGPLARAVEDLRLFMVAGLHGNRATAQPRSSNVAGLRIGYYDDDTTMEASPAIRRAVHEAVAALEHEGCPAVPFRPPEIARAVRIHDWMFGFDRALQLQRLVKDGPIDPRLKQILERMMSASPGPGETALDAAANRYKALFLAVLEEAQIDVIICPPLPIVAPPHGSGHDLEPIQSYGGIYNLLGYPAGVVSVSCVRSGEETTEGRPGSSPSPAGRAKPRRAASGCR